MVLAAALSACNIYVGLKTGTAFGMSIVAALAGFGLWSSIRVMSAGRVRSWSILENNISQTACSAGASVASAGLVAPIPALALLTGQTLEWHNLALWLFSVMLVGIAAAVPLRRQMIVNEGLRFPAGIASAEMLRELHSKGAEALSRVWALVFAGMVAAAHTMSVTACAHYKIPLSWSLPFSIKSVPASSLMITLRPSLLLPGIGALIGIRVCCSLLIGAALAYCALSPVLLEKRYIEPVANQPLENLPAGLEFPSVAKDDISYDERNHILKWSGIMSLAARDALVSSSYDPAYQEAVRELHRSSQSVYKPLSKWLIWPGVTMMVVASLASLAFSWRSIIAAFPGRRKQPRDKADSQADDEFPRRWYYPGLFGVLILSLIMQTALFGIAWWAAGIGVLLTFVLAVVAARVSGETGICATGPMGNITQLFFAVLTPKNPVPNLMAANVTGGAANQCADLMDDLKCGRLLGASPRRQVVAQLCGAFAGALAGSAIYLVLIPNPSALLMTEEWPAPAAMVWKSVAELFAGGLDSLPPGVPVAVAIAAVFAIGLTFLERGVSKKLRPYMLSPVSIGLAFILPAYISMSLFIGGFVAWILGRWVKSWSARFLVATCTGLIVGESLTDIGVVLVRVLRG